ncbi:hypothetical protein M0805_002375 [Coniferiporia weirii]|nr:hypothetical protein M0805_002375 [Coniferiporia weirii]
MATVRPPKGPPLKKGPESNQGSPASPRRAWTNRAPPSPAPAFNANAANARAPANGFPPLGGQANGKAPPNAWGSAEDKQQLLAGLAGSINQTITVSLRTNTRYEGILTFVSPIASDDASLTLKNAKDLSTPNAPPKDSIKIPASNVISFSPGYAGSGTMSKVNDSFRTDAEISRTAALKRERELQAWQPDAVDLAPGAAGSGAFELPRGDDLTFGPGSTGAPGQWDQFAANERLFGVRTHFDEDEYTTRLDRTAKDFKERERRAEQIAAEINGTATNNPHIAEERGLAVDDSGVNEEDKYGAVVRGANAYVPPGARRQNPSGMASPPATSGEIGKDKQDKLDAPVPKVSVNTPDGTEKPLPRATPSPAGNGTVKQPADALPAFRDFVTNEKQRLTQKKQALVKNEMEKRVAELVKFSQNFKLNKPIPEDLVSILAKDEEKQRQIREKSTQDAQSTKARAIGVSASITSTAAQQKTASGAPAAKPVDPSRKPSAPSASATLKSTDRIPTSKSANAIANGAAGSSASGASTKTNGSGKMEASKTVPRISMVIQTIPPFRGKKQSSGYEKTPAAGTSSQPLSPTSQQRLNVNASSFRPNPKAAAFTPNGSTSPQAPSVSPKPKPDSILNSPPTPNPFFGTQIIKKGPPVNVKDDFNPFKHAKVHEAKSIGTNWPYSGKRYMLMFPPPPSVAAPPPQASPHMAPHGPPPPPPPSYDEDAAAQAQAAAAATRGYAVYTYAPFYPGQHPQPMMAGMAGVPPGAFVPGPYMQHMPYPPNMPPPNGQPMYAPPPMGQMPPPQQYMQGPPPGAYPPPPNSAGRPSMPPTPIPAHAHPYYHQSPQLQHAMPYPMMMPPPGPNGPPHPYETGPPPPIPMGGVGHA